MTSSLKAVLSRALLTVLAGIILGVGSAGVASAAPSKQDQTLNGTDQFHALCTALQNVKKQKLASKYCNKNYKKQADQDNAADKICNTYKKQLSSQCDGYSSAIANASAGGTGAGGTYSLGSSKGAHSCGGPGESIDTTIDFGCSHQGPAMLDLAFAIIRFLSNGAGLVIVGSMVWAGIQYTMSRGDPQATASAVGRIQNTFVALLIFIFAYAILNYLVPGIILQ